MPGRTIIAKWNGKCRSCGAPIEADKTKVYWVEGAKGVQCVPCSKQHPTPAPPRERPGADKRALPVDVLARELPDRVWCLLNDTPRPGDTPEQLVRDLGLVLVDYALSLRNERDSTSAPEG